MAAVASRAAGQLHLTLAGPFIGLCLVLRGPTKLKIHWHALYCRSYCLQPDVADLARLAATAASEAAPSTHEESLLVGQVELFASCVGTRAHLVKARSAEAFSSAQTVGAWAVCAACRVLKLCECCFTRLCQSMACTSAEMVGGVVCTCSSACSVEVIPFPKTDSSFIP